MERAKCVVCGKILGPNDTAWWVTHDDPSLGRPILTPCCCAAEAEQYRQNLAEDYRAKLKKLLAIPVEAVQVGSI